MLTIETTVNLPGFHRWPDAPDEVAFLRNVHRHLFFITAEVEVNHDNRDVEFFILQGKLREITQYFWTFNQTDTSQYSAGEQVAATGHSCEYLANAIKDYLRADYEVVRVKVSEDGESAGTWTRDAQG